jgi:hypothetical protein
MASGHKTGGRQKGTPNERKAQLDAKFAEAASRVAAGYDGLIAADEPEIEKAASTLRQGQGAVEAVQADLSGPEGVDRLYAAEGPLFVVTDCADEATPR